MVEENEEEEEGISKFCDIHTYTHAQYKVKTENTPSRRSAPFAPLARGGLVQLCIL